MFVSKIDSVDVILLFLGVSAIHLSSFFFIIILENFNSQQLDSKIFLRPSGCQHFQSASLNHYVHVHLGLRIVIVVSNTVSPHGQWMVLLIAG